MGIVRNSRFMNCGSRIPLGLLLAVAISVGPYRLAVSPSGLPKLLGATALAASGSGKEGDGGDNAGDDNQSDDESSDDEGNDDESDESDDSGGGDDEDDEQGGSGSDDASTTADEATSSESSNAGKSNSNGDDYKGSKSYKPGGAIVRLEVSRSGVKIRYADGGREEIRNGTYELRDPSGQRVERRHAIGSDVARLKAISTRVSIRSVKRREPTKEDIRSVTSSGGSLSVAYSNGWIEEISRGVYRLIDPYERTVATRPATRSDHSRLRDLTSKN